VLLEKFHSTVQKKDKLMVMKFHSVTFIYYAHTALSVIVAIDRNFQGLHRKKDYGIYLLSLKPQVSEPRQQFSLED